MTGGCWRLAKGKLEDLGPCTRQDSRKGEMRVKLVKSREVALGLPTAPWRKRGFVGGREGLPLGVGPLLPLPPTPLLRSLSRFSLLLPGYPERSLNWGEMTEDCRIGQVYRT